MIRYIFLLCLPLAFCHAEYYSQFQQDQYINEHFFLNEINGIFVDIGAHNGRTYSNSKFYEETLGWKGVCIEPIPEVYAELISNRSCICIQGCITDETGVKDFLMVTSPNVDTQMLSGLLDKYNPEHLERVSREINYYGGSKKIIPVMCYQFNDLMELCGFDHIDYLSVDTEGGELNILQSIDFDKIHIRVIDVENNFKDDTSIQNFMKSKGFNFVGYLGCDEIYLNSHTQD